MVVCDNTFELLGKECLTQSVFFRSTLQVNVVIVKELCKSVVAQLAPVELGLVNGKKYNEYFKRPVLQLSIEKPFNVVNKNNSYDVMCTVKGGGLTGQAGAVSLGISKALFVLDGTLRKTLKKEKLLTRDSRKVERKKYGQKKARRRFQFSKR